MVEKNWNLCGTNFCAPSNLKCFWAISQNLVPQNGMPQKLMPAKINALKVAVVCYSK